VADSSSILSKIFSNTSRLSSLVIPSYTFYKQVPVPVGTTHTTPDSSNINPFGRDVIIEKITLQNHSDNTLVFVRMRFQSMVFPAGSKTGDTGTWIRCGSENVTLLENGRLLWKKEENILLDIQNDDIIPKNISLLFKCKLVF